MIGRWLGPQSVCRGHHVQGPSSFRLGFPSARTHSNRVQRWDSMTLSCAHRGQGTNMQPCSPVTTRVTGAFFTVPVKTEHALCNLGARPKWDRFLQHLGLPEGSANPQSPHYVPDRPGFWGKRRQNTQAFFPHCSGVLAGSDRPHWPIQGCLGLPHCAACR